MAAPEALAEKAAKDAVSSEEEEGQIIDDDEEEGEVNGMELDR